MQNHLINGTGHVADIVLGVGHADVHHVYGMSTPLVNKGNVVDYAHGSIWLDVKLHPRLRHAEPIVLGQDGNGPRDHERC